LKLLKSIDLLTRKAVSAIKLLTVW